MGIKMASPLLQKNEESGVGVFAQSRKAASPLTVCFYEVKIMRCCFISVSERKKKTEWGFLLSYAKRLRR
jgi:hypothetical protein